MSDYLYGDWFCKASSESEAVEIIERAVVSGAERDETLEIYLWDGYGAWGVSDGKTHTQTVGFYRFGLTTEYTIEQLREKFPLPGELERDGEGLPLIGQRVEINMGNLNSDRRKDGETGRVLSLSVNSRGSTIAMIEIDGTNGECDAVLVRCLRPFRSERDQWVEQALEHDADTVKDMLESIYDALKSGDLKAPEVE